MFRLADDKYITVTHCYGIASIKMVSFEQCQFGDYKRTRKEEIELSVSEWNVLKGLIDKIDALITRKKTKDRTDLDMNMRESNWPGLTQPSPSVFHGTVALEE